MANSGFIWTCEVKGCWGYYEQSDNTAQTRYFKCRCCGNIRGELIEDTNSLYQERLEERDIREVK